jgi:hypothetical protein
MSERDDGKAGSEDAVEIEAEIIDAEVVSEEKPKSRNDSAIFIAIALIVGLVAGPFIQTLLSPYLPAALQPVAPMADRHNDHQDEVDGRLAELEAQHKDAATTQANLAQQIRELQAAEASRSVGNAAKDTDTSAIDEQLKSLEQRLQREITAGKAAIERMVGDLKAESARAEKTVSNIDTAELQARLNVLETNLLKLSGELELALRQAQQLAQEAVQPVDGRVKELAGKVDEMAKEAAKRVEAIKRETFAIALVQLRSAIEKGEAFADLLTAFVNRFGGDAATDPPLDILKTHASGGVKSLATMKAELAPTIRLILSQSEGADASFWTQTKERLSRLVTVRRTGAVAGDDVEAVLARAELAMDKDNLAGAVAEMKTLPEANKEKAKSWISDGDSHLAVEDAMAKLEQHAIMQSGSN